MSREVEEAEVARWDTVDDEGANDDGVKAVAVPTTREAMESFMV
jgi:hypothetical protein